MSEKQFQSIQQNSQQNVQQNPQLQFPPLEGIINMAKQMTKDMDKKNINKNEINQMIDNVTGMMSSQFGQGMDPKFHQGIKDATRNAMSKIMDGIDLEEEKKEESSRSAQEPLKNIQDNLKKPQDSNNYDLLNDDDEVDELNPKVNDLEISLNVTLEDIYNGTTKKISIMRERIKKDPKTGRDILVEERKKIQVPIEKGSRDSQVIRYNHQGSEKFGYETGDIAVVLKQNGHPQFAREKDNLFVSKNISLYESYAAANKQINLVIFGLDGTCLKLNCDGTPLHSNNGLRKVIGMGMPLHKLDPKVPEKTHGDLYIRFNLILPKEMSPTVVNSISKIFPQIDKDVIYNDKSLVTPNNQGIDASVLKVKNCSLEEISEEDLQNLNCESDSDDDYSDNETSEEEYE